MNDILQIKYREICFSHFYRSTSFCLSIQKRVHFVIETKSTMDSLNLRPIEKAKIDCAKKLFSRLSDGFVTYDYVNNYQELLNKVRK